MKLILSAFARQCEDAPSATAIVDADGSAHSWSALRARVELVRALLCERTTPGARVGISVPSGSEFWIAVLATASAGRTPCLLPCPLPGLLQSRLERELGAPFFMLNTTMLAEASHSSARSSEEREPAGAILLSSGTTERSRFIIRSNQAIDRITSILLEEGLASRSDEVASFLPMHHAYGFEHAFLAPIAAGARVHALGTFSVERVTDALARGATTLPLVPIAVAALAEARPAAPRLRCVITAGTVLPLPVRAAFEAAYSAPLIDLYGASEVGTIWLDRGDGGIAVRGVDVAIIGEDASAGELAVRSECMYEGIIEGDGTVQRATSAERFHTGDLGCLAANGHLRITGRTKLVFDVGGLKVNPIEVEQALELHPAIARALVKPVNAGSMLDRVAADIELRKGKPAPTPQELREHLAPLILPHAIPRTFTVVETLAATASGKLLRASSHMPIAPVVRRPDGLEARADREKYTKRLFDESACGYDNSSGFAFMRGGRWYRRRMLMSAGVKPGSAHLDVGSGTGLCAALAQEIVGPTGRVVALDPSSGMLEVARKRGVREIVEGRAESLPFPDASFDTLSMSYMLRHIEDLMLAFREARRVLRPGGRMVIFEVTRPASAPLSCAFDVTMNWVVPSIGVLASGRPATFPMMQYWAETMRDAARPERVLDALAACGFTGTRHRLQLGVFSCYRGSAPLA